jgi:hypothetical protein
MASIACLCVLILITVLSGTFSSDIDRICHGTYNARYYGDNSTGPSSKYNTTPLQFRFNSSSHINGWWCVKMGELTTGWTNNYLCTNKDIGLVWRCHHNECRPTLKCTATVEPLDPQVWWWQDNALCLPVTSNVEMIWSYCGSLPEMLCVRLLDNASPQPFSDNFLCWKEHQG